MECVIFYLDDTDSKFKYVLDSDGGQIAVYPSRVTAMRFVEKFPTLKETVYQIVELNDL